jgi:hypothetical protein
LQVDRVVDKKRIIGKMEGRGGGEAQGVTYVIKLCSKTNSDL